MNNPKINQNVSTLPDTKSPNIYPSILNMNPGKIYPDLSLSLGSSHIQQSNLSKRTNNQGLSLSISQIKVNQSNQPDRERDSNGSVVTRSQKFFNNFKQKKKSQQNQDHSAMQNLKMLQDLDQDVQDVQDEKINKQESAHSRSQHYKQSPVQENRKLSMTQKFMSKFNNSKGIKKSWEDPSEQQSNKQKTIKVSYNQISSSSSNQQQEDQLTNVINIAKQQLKNDQQKKLVYSYISDNLQSCNQEPMLCAMMPSNEQVEGQQNFKKAISKLVENVQNQEKQEGQKQQNYQDENSDGISEESSEQNRNSQRQQQVEINQKIEQKKQFNQKQQVNRQRQQQQNQQWTSEEQEQQDEESQEAEQELDDQADNKKSQIIGFRLYKSLTSEKIKELTQTTEKYYPSNYFHAGPRYQILGFLREIATQIQHLSTGDLLKKYNACVAQIENLTKINTVINSTKNILQDLGQKVRLYLTEDVINEILNVISQYNSCNYFHVGPRRQMFSWVLYLISLVEKSRKNIAQKSPSKPQGPNGLRGNSNQAKQEEQDNRQEQQQQQEEEQEQDEEQQEEEQNKQQNQFDNDDDVEEQEEDDQDEQEANDVINNSIHDLLSNYANNDISFLSTQRSLNIQNSQQQNSIKFSLEDIKNYEIGKKLKQSLTPTLIQSLGQTLMQYNSSNYFHVGPRYQLLGFMREFAKFVQRILKNGGITKIDQNLNNILVKKSIKMGEEVKKYMTVGKMQQIVSTCQNYDSSNYFHVGPRYSIFGDVRKLISISQL